MKDVSGSQPAQQRPPMVTTALGALTIFLPLFALLIWWASVHRIAPPEGGDGLPIDGTLPGWMAVVSAALVAGGAAVVAALILANHDRLRAVLRLRRGRMGLASLLALVTPVTIVSWLPMPYAFVGYLAGSGLIFGMFASLLAAVGVLGVILLFWLALTLVWSVPVNLVISGVRSRLLRGAILALIWWAVYGAWLLADGYQSVGL